jgi:DNA-binding MarR family transcriptional regulator
LLDVLRETIVGSVRRDAPDLTARQLAVLLICCLDRPPHTVRGLAERLGVPKPAITRAIDRLEELGLLEREDDPSDRRSILLLATASGRAFVEELRAMMVAAAERHAALPAEAPAEVG